MQEIVRLNGKHAIITKIFKTIIFLLKNFEILKKNNNFLDNFSIIRSSIMINI